MPAQFINATPARLCTLDNLPGLKGKHAAGFKQDKKPPEPSEAMCTPGVGRGMLLCGKQTNENHPDGGGG